MKEQLFDIVKAISAVQFDIVKITAENGNVTIQSRLQNDEVGMVILKGELKNNTPEIDGIFGLSNIGMLVGLCNVEAFKDKDAKVTLNHQTRGDVLIPEEIVFEKSGFSKASYRLTAEKTIPKQFKEVGQLTWDVEISDVKRSTIAEFAQLAGIYSNQERQFIVKTEGDALKFLIGAEGAATHKAQYVFAKDIEGKIKPSFSWNVAGFLSVLKFGVNNNHTTTVRFNNQGVIQVEIDTDIAVYTYMFPGSN